jgi:hypothetical protein
MNEVPSSLLAADKASAGQCPNLRRTVSQLKDSLFVQDWRRVLFIIGSGLVPGSGG